MEEQKQYRYPGSRPFNNTELDRLLFSGRDEEKEKLLHLILAKDLFVLYGKSGIGKTSLLNAGIFDSLLRKKFIPFSIQLNDESKEPRDLVINGIEEYYEKNYKVQYDITLKSVNKYTLWHYFKTVIMWDSDGDLLSPVLVLDQFEEFFNTFDYEKRKEFIQELSDLNRGRIPEATTEEDLEKYGEGPPEINIIISMREDYLGQLDELSVQIPDILHDRFRLTELTKKQARLAIEKPAEKNDNKFEAPKFSFDPEARESILNFLTKRKESADDITSNTIAPFQLQILCEHFEKLIISEKEKKKDVITVNDLGGNEGMMKILQKHVDEKINIIASGRMKKNLYKMLEEGLISKSQKRLFIVEGELLGNYHITRNELEKLCEYRILRKEPRSGMDYYELSHDTLIKPILNSRSSRIIKSSKIISYTAISVLLILVFYFAIAFFNYRSADEEFDKGNVAFEKGDTRAAKVYYWESIESKTPLFNPFNIIQASINPFLKLGKIYSEDDDLDSAKITYDNAIKRGIANEKIFVLLGNVYGQQGNTKYLIKYYDQAIESRNEESKNFDLQDTISTIKEMIEKFEADELAEVNLNYLVSYSIDNNFNNFALRVFEKALDIPKYELFLELDNVSHLFKRQNEKTSHEILDSACNYFSSLIKNNREKNKDFAKGLEDSLNIYVKHPSIVGKYELITALYDLVDQVDTNFLEYKEYLAWAEHYEYLRNHRGAIKVFGKIVKRDFQKKYTAHAYFRIAQNHHQLGEYNKAIENFKKTLNLESNPNYRAEFYKNWGRTLQFDSQYEESNIKIKKSIRDKNSSRLHKWWGENFIRLAEELNEDSLYYEAISKFSEAVEINSKNRDAYAFWGVCLNRLGNEKESKNKYIEALRIIKNGLDDSPGDTELLEDRAHYLWTGKIDTTNYEETIKTSEAAVRIDPNAIWLRRNLAMARLLRMEFGRGEEEYDRILALAKKQEYSDTKYGWNTKKLLQERILRDLEYVKKENNYYEVPIEKLNLIIKLVDDAIDAL